MQLSDAYNLKIILLIAFDRVMVLVSIKVVTGG